MLKQLTGLDVGSRMSKNAKPNKTETKTNTPLLSPDLQQVTHERDGAFGAASQQEAY
jgi:hypothetical protein